MICVYYARQEREGDRFANLHTRGLQRLTRQKASNLTQEPNRTGTDEVGIYINTHTNTLYA